MLKEVVKITFVLECILILRIIQPIYGQYCSVVINNSDNNKNNDNSCSSSGSNFKKEVEIKVFTVGEEDSDGYKRFTYSTEFYGIKVHNLASETLEENTQRFNGSHKVKLLKEVLKPLKDNENIIVIFTDSHDTIFTTGLDEILKKFYSTNANILFGTENYYYLQHRITKLYSEIDVEILEDKLLNAKMFMGFASSIYKMLEKNPIENISENNDDQIYYTKIFLNEDLRNEYRIELDTTSQIFQSLNEQIHDIKLNVNNETFEGSLENIKYNTKPNIIYGNGPNRIQFNSFANYLGGTFKDKKCLICEKNLVSYKDDNLPSVTLAIFIEKAVPFFEEFLENIKTINYPKKNMNLFIHNNILYHEKDVIEFVKKFRAEYKTVKFLTTSNEIDEVDARKLSIDEAIKRKSDFLFVIDAEVRIDDSNILLDLLKYNRNFIAPLLTLKGYNYSNFWGALSQSGYYARSHDYLDIIRWRRKGIWNVPFVALCYLVNKSIFKKMNFDHMKFDPDIALSESLRNQGIFMNIINTKQYGHLVDNEDFDPTLKHPDFYMLISNQLDWEKRYIHPDYQEQLKPNFTHTQPCPDVYWFPITTERFCKDLVSIMENYGKWSDGSNKDPRLEGGYEAVPTRDIHMTQVDLQEMWLHFLKLYVKPLKDIVYQDPDTEPPATDMNFVVRYRPDEQPSLKPHFDSSTYTINIALNRAGVDYEGGGCRFVRYNCSVRDTKMGWMLMHPGKLTHLHEGLTVTNGTRYIMVSFVVP